MTFRYLPDKEKQHQRKKQKQNKQCKIATDNNLFALADRPPLVRSQLGCRHGMPHILTQEAATDTFWLMESFMGGNGTCAPARAFVR